MDNYWSCLSFVYRIMQSDDEDSYEPPCTGEGFDVDTSIMPLYIPKSSGQPWTYKPPPHQVGHAELDLMMTLWTNTLAPEAFFNFATEEAVEAAFVRFVEENKDLPAKALQQFNALKSQKK